MYRVFLLSVVLFFIGACNQSEDRMVINAEVKGLVKGKFYLQKIKDTLLINVDSAIVSGKDNFTLIDEVKSPEIYLLSMSNSEKVLQFFGEPTKIDIKASLKHFNTDFKVTGSKNQELLEEFNDNIRRFNNQQLDLIKVKFEAQKLKNDSILKTVEKQENNIEKRKLRYAINFAFSNADYEVAPYITLAELYNLNIKYLDTITNEMSPKIKKSKYGKKLIDYIEKIEE